MSSQFSSEIKKYFSKYPQRKYKVGEILIDPDNTPSGAFFLSSGAVRMFTYSENGNEMTLNIFKAPSFFPMGWIINDKQDKYYYEALSNVKTYISPKPEFNKFIKKEKNVLYELMQRIYIGLEGYMTRMEALMNKNAYIKTLTHLIIYHRRFSGNVDFEIKQRELAAETGLTRETINRSINKLKKKGLLKYYNGKLEIPNISELETELQINRDVF